MRVPSATGLVFASLAISSGSTLAAPAVIPPPSPNPGAGSPNPGLSGVKSPRPNGLDSSPHMGSPRMLHQSFFNARNKLGPPAIRVGSGSRRSLPRKKRDITPPNSPSLTPQGAGSVSVQGLGLLSPEVAAGVNNLVGEILPGAVELLSRDGFPHPELLPEDAIATPMVRSLAHMSLRDETEALRALDPGTAGIASAAEPALVGPLVGKNGHVIMETNRRSADAVASASLAGSNVRRQVPAPDAQTVSAEGLGLLPPDLAATIGELLKTVGGIGGGLPAPVGPLVGGLLDSVGGTVTGLLGRDIGEQFEHAPTSPPGSNDGEDSCDEDSDCDDPEDGGAVAPEPGHTRRSYMPLPHLPGEAIPGFASAWSNGLPAYDDAASILTASSMGLPAIDSLSLPVSPEVAADLARAIASNQVPGYLPSFIPQPDAALPLNTVQGLPIPNGGNPQHSPQRTSYQQEQPNKQNGTPLPNVQGFPAQVLGGIPVAGGLINGLYGKIGQAPSSVTSMVGQVSPLQNTIIGFLPNGMPVFGQVPSQPVQSALQHAPIPQNSRQGQREQYSGGGQAEQNPVSQVAQSVRGNPALNQVLQSVQNTPVGNTVGTVYNTLNGGVNTATGVLDGLGGILPFGQLGGSSGGLLGLLNANVDGDKLAVLESSPSSATPVDPSSVYATPLSSPSPSPQSSGVSSSSPTGTLASSSTLSTQGNAVATPYANEEASWAGASGYNGEGGDDNSAAVASVSLEPTAGGSGQSTDTWAASSTVNSYSPSETGTRTAGLATQSASALSGATTTTTPSAPP